MDRFGLTILYLVWICWGTKLIAEKSTRPPNSVCTWGRLPNSVCTWRCLVWALFLAAGPSVGCIQLLLHGSGPQPEPLVLSLDSNSCSAQVPRWHLQSILKNQAGDISRAAGSSRFEFPQALASRNFFAIYFDSFYFSQTDFKYPRIRSQQLLVVSQTLFFFVFARQKKSPAIFLSRALQSKSELFI